MDSRSQVSPSWEQPAAQRSARPAEGVQDARGLDTASLPCELFLPLPPRWAHSPERRPQHRPRSASGRHWLTGADPGLQGQRRTWREGGIARASEPSLQLSSFFS